MGYFLSNFSFMHTYAHIYTDTYIQSSKWYYRYAVISQDYVILEISQNMYLTLKLI